MSPLATTPEQSPWQWLHDATLVDLCLDWRAGTLTINLRVGSPRAGTVRLAGHGVSRLECPRGAPWGTSASVNEVRGPLPSAEGQRLEIEVQSGDTIVVHAGSFELSEIMGAAAPTNQPK
jgi:hypothetical protein